MLRACVHATEAAFDGETVSLRLVDLILAAPAAGRLKRLDLNQAAVPPELILRFAGGLGALPWRAVGRRSMAQRVTMSRWTATGPSARRRLAIGAEQGYGRVLVAARGSLVRPARRRGVQGYRGPLSHRSGRQQPDAVAEGERECRSAAATSIAARRAPATAQ